MEMKALDKLLDGRVAIITGSGRGIGRAAALMFAREGAKVVVSDIDAEPAEQTVLDIGVAGGEALAHVGDVTDPDFGERIVAAAREKWGKIHIIVNNAGFTWDALVHKMSDDQWDKILDLHLKAPFRIIRSVKPYFCEAAKEEMELGVNVSRKIINVSSLSGLGGNVGQANYSAAKAGIVGLTKTISKEWARYNVQCNCVAFGFIDTRLTQEKEKGVTVEGANQKIAVGVPKAHRDTFMRMIPMGRPGTTEEAAGAILFFASPLSNYVSGQVLAVSGGMAQ
jgi:3-oxoacyl-[acyl-carrier protein] reductase